MLIRSFIVVFGCLAAGEAVIYLTHLPLPSSIFGLIFLFTLLKLGWVKLATMQTLTTFLMENMSLFLIPPCVAVVTHLDLIKADFWPILTASVVSTFLVLIATGKVHHYMRKRS